MDVSSLTARTSRSIAFLSSAAVTATRTRLSIEESFTFSGLSVESIVFNVVRNARIDEAADRFARTNFSTNFGRRDWNCLVLREDNAAVRSAKFRLRHTRLKLRSGIADIRSRQHDEVRELEDAIDVFPSIERCEIVVADDPVERRLRILRAQPFERLPGVRDLSAIELLRRDVRDRNRFRRENRHREAVIARRELLLGLERLPVCRNVDQLIPLE